MDSYKVNLILCEDKLDIERTLIITPNTSFEKLHEIICILFNFKNTNKYKFIFDDLNIIIHNTGSLNMDNIDSRFELIDKYFQAFSQITYINTFWKIKLNISSYDYDKKYPTITTFKGKYNPSTKITSYQEFSQILELNNPEEDIKKLNEINILSLQEKLIQLFNIPYTIENNKIIILKQEGTLNNYLI